jgi:hypothetical protein
MYGTLPRNCGVLIFSGPNSSYYAKKDRELYGKNLALGRLRLANKKANMVACAAAHEADRRASIRLSSTTRFGTEYGCPLALPPQW